MKNVMTFLLLLLTGVAAVAQNISKNGELYVDANGNPYSGLYKTFHASGGVKASYTIDKGILHGPAIFYYESGSKMEAGNYAKNEREGMWESWNESGSKTGEASFSKGMKHGRWIVWDAQGHKRAEMFYTMGKKTETWSMWDEQGALLNQKTYLPEQ